MHCTAKEQSLPFGSGGGLNFILQLARQQNAVPSSREIGNANKLSGKFLPKDGREERQEWTWVSSGPAAWAVS